MPTENYKKQLTTCCVGINILLDLKLRICMKSNCNVSHKLLKQVLLKVYSSFKSIFLFPVFTRVHFVWTTLLTFNELFWNTRRIMLNEMRRSVLGSILWVIIVYLMTWMAERILNNSELIFNASLQSTSFAFLHHYFLSSIEICFNHPAFEGEMKIPTDSVD